MLFGDYLSDADNENKAKGMCSRVTAQAKSIFGSTEDAYDSLVYIDDRPYRVGGVLAQQGTVEAGISADDAIFIPYATGIKYLTGSDISPTITVIAQDVDNIEPVYRRRKERACSQAIPMRSLPSPMQAAKWKRQTSPTGP